jgi:hypothetical protein
MSPPRRTPPRTGAPPRGDGVDPPKQIRGSAWMVAQQTAQMVGELGGGIGGIAGAVHVAKEVKGQPKDGTEAKGKDK